LELLVINTLTITRNVPKVNFLILIEIAEKTKPTIDEINQLLVLKKPAGWLVLQDYAS